MKKSERTEKQASLDQILKELEEIGAWFDDKDKMNLEEAIKKIRRGGELVKISKKKLQEAENEFEEIGI